MKLINKIAAVLMTVTILATCSTGCKRQEPPEPDPVLTDSEFKELASASGSEFFEAFRARNITNMATLSEEELRSDYINQAEDYYEYVESSIWIEEFYNLYLYDIQVVESTFSRTDETHGEITYKIIISNYNSDQGGALVSYDVALKFLANAKSETVYITNPELSIQLYEDMVDDYARFLLDLYYPSWVEPSEPDPTPTPEPTPTPVPPTPTPVPPPPTVEE